MADDDKAKAGAHTTARRAERDRAAANEAPTRRPLPTPRKLTRAELEALRSRLQKKFH